LSLAHVFVKVAYLNQETSKESFRCSIQAATCSVTTQSNHSKVDGIQLSALPRDTTSELDGLYSHYPFNAESQAGNLWISSFKVFWSVSTRESNTDLPSTRRTP